MCALPLVAPDFYPDDRDPVEDDFWIRFHQMQRRYTGLWSETSDERPALGDKVSGLSRLSTYRHSRRFIDWLAAQIEGFPSDKTGRSQWRHNVKQAVQDFGEKRLGWPARYRDLVVSETFYESTLDFVRRAREFDPEISDSAIAQALRNVWIINSLQMLLECRECVTPAVFAYSMLYPYTDNLLDDPSVSAGEDPDAADLHESKVRLLLAMIEAHFDRQRFPWVYSSLQAIHAGQESSLAQQDGEVLMTDSELLAVSVCKGGASVLADGYLISGDLDRSTAEFCMGYGVLLQLLDDLQDVRMDLEAGHQTLFTLQTGRGPLDRLASRLYHFIDSVVSGVEHFGGHHPLALRDLIHRNCVFLLVGAIAANQDHFSRSFRRALERRWPLSLQGMRRLESRAAERFRGVVDLLCRARGVERPIELLE